MCFHSRLQMAVSWCIDLHSKAYFPETSDGDHSRPYDCNAWHCLINASRNGCCLPFHGMYFTRIPLFGLFPPENTPLCIYATYGHIWIYVYNMVLVTKAEVCSLSRHNSFASPTLAFSSQATRLMLEGLRGSGKRRAGSLGRQKP